MYLKLKAARSVGPHAYKCAPGVHVVVRASFAHEIGQEVQPVFSQFLRKALLFGGKIIGL